MLAALAVGGAGAMAQAARPAPGVSVVDGSLALGERAICAIGINYYDCFLRVLRKPEDKAYPAGFATLARFGIPVARFICGGFWPVEWKLYRTRPTEYFGRLDDVIAQAEKSRIGLIPSLFWFHSTVPDLVGEPICELGNPKSPSHAFMRDYARQVIERYRDSPAIWAWEVGNEYTLAADLPNASQHRPPVAPKVGTPQNRSEKDDLTSQQATACLKTVAGMLREFDPRRAILSGNAVPRAHAWHNTAERSWKADSEAQFREVLRRDNPDPIDTLCVHLYPQKADRFADRKVEMDGLMAACVDEAKRAGKPLVIGEFGWAGSEDERGAFTGLLESIVRHRVPLSLAWTFDSPEMPNLSIRAEGPRAWMLPAMQKANERLRG